MYFRSLLLTLFVFSIYGAQAQKQMATSPHGLKYINYTKLASPKAQLGDMISFHYIISNAKDSQLFNSYNVGQPGTTILYFKNLGTLADGFLQMAKGDSAAFFVSADSMLKNQKDPGIQPGTLVKYTIKMLEVKTQATLQKEAAEAQANEAASLARVLKEKYPNAKKTASGLYYVIRKEGTGPIPKAGQEITAHYKGSLANGEMFDTDSSRPEPFKFKLGEHQVIPGWDEGFALMKVGTKATLIIPSALAYGARGAGKVIGPYSVLVFDVELVDAKDLPGETKNAQAGSNAGGDNANSSKDHEQDLIQKYLKGKAPKAKKTASGLYYIIDQEGTGPLPKPGQTVFANYAGYFMDGTVFDKNNSGSFNFILGQHRVIAGWEEGFSLLKKGTKARLIIPYELAYGERGAGGAIPPYAPLVFEVELVDIK